MHATLSLYSIHIHVFVQYLILYRVVYYGLGAVMAGCMWVCSYRCGLSKVVLMKGTVPSMVTTLNGSLPFWHSLY